MRKTKAAPLKGLIKTKKDLFNFAKNAFGLRFARHAVCEHHQAPLDAVWDIYSQQVRNAIIIGSRMSGKTSLVAFLQVLFSLSYDNCESVSVAARVDQAKLCYDYIRRMLYRHEIFAKYTPPPQSPNHSSERLILHNGSIIRILPATEKGLNAPHPHKVFFDEVDLIDWAVLQQGLSMAKGDETAGIVGQQIFASSWKKSFGPLARLSKAILSGGALGEGGQNLIGGRVYRWCVFDVMKRCPSSKACEECKLVKKTLSTGEEISFYDICQGRCLKSDGFLPREEAWERFIQMDEAVFRSEWLSDEPTPLYAVFNIPPSAYLCAWNPTQINGRIVVGVDVGTSAPTVFLLLQVLPSGIVVVFDEIRRYSASIKAIIEEAYRIQSKYNPEVFVVDPRSAMVIKEMQDARLRAQPAPFLFTNTSARMQEKINRIRLVQNALDVSPWGFPRLFFVSERCELLLKEMRDYSFETDAEGNPTDKLPDGNDDGIDALAYAFSYLEVNGFLPRAVPVEVIRNDWEVVRQYILHQGEVAKVAEVSQPLVRSEALQAEIVRRMRALIAEQMRSVQPFVNAYLPTPEMLDDRIAQKLHQIEELRHLAQVPDLPHEERERIRRVLAEMQEDVEKAWTAMELKSVMSAHDVSTGSLPLFFLDILFRPGDW
jgi:hypothetical protein